MCHCVQVLKHITAKVGFIFIVDLTTYWCVCVCDTLTSPTMRVLFFTLLFNEVRDYPFSSRICIHIFLLTVLVLSCVNWK